MFLPHKSDTGAVLPWEYKAAAAGTYKAGQLVNVDASGKMAAIAADQTTTPPYLCMTDATLEADELMPVTRVSDDFIYETTLAAEIADAAVGQKLQVAAGGLQAAAGAGTFELTELEGTAAGAIVRGRWV